MYFNRAFALLCTTLLFGSSLAFGANSLKVVSVSGAPGSDVTVEITASSDQNFAGAEFDVLFDATKLQIKETAKGADAAGLDPTALSEDDITAANTSGKLVVSMIDITLSNPVQAGTDKKLFVLTFTIATGASGEISVSLDQASLSDVSGMDITVTVTNGTVTVGSQEPEGNKLSIKDATGRPGSDVAVKILATSDTDIVGLNFDLLFDITKLQVKTVVNGADSTGFTLVGADSASISNANAKGKLAISQIDLTLSNPVPAGKDKELLVVTFTIAADASGDISLTLTNATLADSTAKEIEVELVDGTITVSTLSPGDVNGNGSVDIFDLLALLKVLGGSTPASAASDVNASGATDIFDLLALLKVLSGK
ncbi:MAG TPA: cohesin domain-containing protein [archaeon]|nr:cohesin domain-containing protein [archaeon]